MLQSPASQMPPSPHNVQHHLQEHPRVKRQRIDPHAIQSSNGTSTQQPQARLMQGASPVPTQSPMQSSGPSPLQWQQSMLPPPPTLASVSHRMQGCQSRMAQALQRLAALVAQIRQSCPPDVAMQLQQLVPSGALENAQQALHSAQSDLAAVARTLPSQGRVEQNLTGACTPAGSTMSPSPNAVMMQQHLPESQQVFPGGVSSQQQAYPVQRGGIAHPMQQQQVCSLLHVCCARAHV